MYRRGLMWRLREFYFWKIRYDWIPENWLIVIGLVMAIGMGVFIVWVAMLGANRHKPDQPQIQSIAESNSSQPSSVVAPGAFWSEPMVRDLTITDSRSGQVVTVRQLQLVSYQARPGDEIKPETTEDGKPTVWVYRNGCPFKEAPLVRQTPDGLLIPVLSYQLVDGTTGKLVTFFCVQGGTVVP